MRRHFRIAALAVRLTAHITAAALLCAPFDADRSALGQDAFIDSDGEIDDLLARIGSPAASDTPADVLKMVDEVLERLDERKTVLFRRPGGKYREARLELRVRVDSLPPEMALPVRERYGPVAARAFESHADPEKAHEEIARRHPLCPSSRESAAILARMAFERSDLEGALMWLYMAGDGDGFRPGADSLLAALCYDRSGFRARAAGIAARNGCPDGVRALFAGKRPLAERPDGGFVPVSGKRFAEGPDDSGPAQGRSRGVAALHGNRAFAPFARGVECFDAGTGELAWRFPEKPLLFSEGRTSGLLVETAAGDGMVVVSFGSFLAAFDDRSGKMLWRFGSSDILPPPPAGFGGVPKVLWNPVSLSAPCRAGDGFVVVAVAAPGTVESWLVFLDKSGRVGWTLFLSSSPHERLFGSAPVPGLAVSGSTAFIATGTGAAAAVDLVGPRFLWGRVLDPLPPAAVSIASCRGNPPRRAAPVPGTTAVYFLSHETERLDALDSTTGETVWSRRLGLGSSLAGLDGDVLVAPAEMEILGLDRWSGRILWKAGTDGGLTGVCAMTHGRVHAPVQDGILTIRAANGSRAAMLDLDPPGRPFNLSAAGERLVAGFRREIRLFENGSGSTSKTAAFEAAASTLRFAEAAFVAEAPDAGLAPAALLCACLRAAQAGDAGSAIRLLGALEGGRGGSRAQIAAARIAVATAQAAAGMRAEAIERFAGCSAFGDAVVERGGSPWPADALAMRDAAALLGDEATARLFIPADDPPGGRPLRLLRHAPAAFGETGMLRPRALPGQQSAIGAFTHGRSFVQRVDSRTGTVLWRTPLGSWKGNAAAAAGLLFAATSSSITAVDCRTGKVAWSAPLLPEEAALSSSPGSEGDFELVPGRRCVAAVFRSGVAAGFDALSGRRAWSAKLPGGNWRALFQDPETAVAMVFHGSGVCASVDPDAGPVNGKPFAFEGAVHHAGTGKFLALRPGRDSTSISLRSYEDGAKIWEKEFERERFGSVVSDPQSGAAVLIPLDLQPQPLQLRCVSLADGATLFQAPTSLGRPSAVLGHSRLYVPFSPSVIHAYDVRTGKQVWSTFVHGAQIVPDHVVCTADIVAAGIAGGGITVFSAESGRQLGTLGADRGRLNSLSAAGPGLFAVMERGACFFGPPLLPQELAAGRFAVAGELEMHLFTAAGRPQGIMKAAESAIRESGAVGLSGTDPRYALLRGAAESAAFASKPVAVARRFPYKVDAETLLEAPWSEEDAVGLGAGSVAFQREGDASSLWGGEADLSARLYLGWDEIAFHVLIDVVDDRQIPHDGESESWSGDVVVLAVDRLCDGGFAADDDDSIFWAFRAKEREPKPGDEEERDPARKELGGLKIKDRPGGGLRYRFSLPWEDFFNSHLRQRGLRARQIRPAPGVRIGLNFLVLDDDGGGVRKRLALSPGLGASSTRSESFRSGVWPGLWTTVVLR